MSLWLIRVSTISHCCDKQLQLVTAAAAAATAAAASTLVAYGWKSDEQKLELSNHLSHVEKGSCHVKNDTI